MLLLFRGYKRKVYKGVVFPLCGEKLMIDYQHRLIQDMKQKYRAGRDAYEEACIRSKIWRANKVQLFTEAAQALQSAQTDITDLIAQMESATDLPTEDREYYVPFMQGHLQNITQWYETAQQYLPKSTEEKK